MYIFLNIDDSKIGISIPEVVKTLLYSFYRYYS